MTPTRAIWLLWMKDVINATLRDYVYKNIDHYISDLRMKILKSTEKRQDEATLMLHKLKTQLKDKICSKEGR